jgi:2OG-Fe(II) oxygenase superfamily
MNTHEKGSITDLKTKGHVAVEYPADLRVAVEEAVAAWVQFCALSTVAKTALPYSNGGTGVGYELKNGVGNKADRKENFDVTTAGIDWLAANIEAIGNPVALDFVERATGLVAYVKPLILEFARQCEEEYGLEGFLAEVEASEPQFFIRFIHYFGDRELGDETATAHTDQSGFTLHLFESDRGLQCLPYDGEWEDMHVSAGETVIIPAMQMQLRSVGNLRALCHRVIAYPETAEAGRYAAVCFVQLVHTPKYDKDGAGRLQEKEPGFNYDMPIVEFRKLFKG